MEWSNSSAQFSGDRGVLGDHREFLPIGGSRMGELGRHTGGRPMRGEARLARDLLRAKQGDRDPLEELLVPADAQDAPAVRRPCQLRCSQIALGSAKAVGESLQMLRCASMAHCGGGDAWGPPGEPHRWMLRGRIIGTPSPWCATEGGGWIRTASPSIRPL